MGLLQWPGNRTQAGYAPSVLFQIYFFRQSKKESKIRGKIEVITFQILFPVFLVWQLASFHRDFMRYTSVLDF